MTKERLRINFVLPPCPRISGGPLAILEYANRLDAKGHTVTVTTNPDSYWPGTNPFPWFNFRGQILYVHDRKTAKTNKLKVRESLVNIMPKKWEKNIVRLIKNITNLDRLLPTKKIPLRALPIDWMSSEALIWAGLIEAMPDCDLNIATLWSTAYPVYLSGKGKPVYFMQHYEEIFYPLVPDMMLCKLMSRSSYDLPIFKIANSSWLQKLILERHGQLVPFSNNGIELNDFSPHPKKSCHDGIIRVVTYSRPEQWKGFADAVAAMRDVIDRYGASVEWHVFGYEHPTLPYNNPYAPYKYHPKVIFSDLAVLYATSDICLCPSWYESFPLPPLEAMASATAVVTTEHGTEDYALHEENALVVGARDAKGMAESVQRLIEDPGLRNRLALSGRKTAETFDWRHAVEKREKILIDIHHGNVDYDELYSAKFKMADFSGIEFERAPSSVSLEQAGLFEAEGVIFYICDGIKHHVTNPSLLSEMLRHGIGYIQLSSLDAARTPTGTPLVSFADIPTAPSQKLNE